jgi:glycerol-3-phosphate responsive antiterminator
MHKSMRNATTDLVILSRIIPVVENRVQFAPILKQQCKGGMIMLRNCNLLDLGPLMIQAHQKGYTVYVNIDHANGVHADAAGLTYLAQQLHVTGIESANPKTLALAKSAHLATVLHVYAADSAGLESALEVADPHSVDLLDISPALAIPYIRPALSTVLPLPFVGSGLLSTAQQVQEVINAGALGALVAQTDFAI